MRAWSANKNRRPFRPPVLSVEVPEHRGIFAEGRIACANSAGLPVAIYFPPRRLRHSPVAAVTAKRFHALSVDLLERAAAEAFASFAAKLDPSSARIQSCRDKPVASHAPWRILPEQSLLRFNPATSVPCCIPRYRSLPHRIASGGLMALNLFDGPDAISLRVGPRS
jgi:hypothetical protein